MLTEKQARALKTVAECTGRLGITPAFFAQTYFDTPEHRHLLTAVSNTGNGACMGKKAWIAAGSVLGRLARSGLLRHTWGHYSLSEKGREELAEWEKINPVK